MQSGKPIKEGYSLLYRHFKHVIDILALEFYVEGVAIVALSLADVALDVNVGQEVHFDTLDSVALARLTSSAAYVEGKSACVIALCLCVLGLCKEVSYIGEKSRVGCGVRARCSAYGALVDCYNLVKVLKSRDFVNLAGVGYRAVKVAGKGSVEYRIDKRGFSASRNSRNSGKGAERNINVNVLKVVFPSTDNRELLTAAAPSLGRHLYVSSARKIRTRYRPFACGYLLGSSGCDNLAAVNSRAGSYVNYEISLAHRVLVVLDDYYAVSKLTQIFESVNKLSVIALMKSYTRLVKNIKNARERRAYLRGKPYSLCLAARKCACGACKG